MAELSLHEFADKLHEIMPAIMKGFSRYQINELFKGKITIPQLLIMDFLQREGQSTMTRLAHEMHVTTAAMTGIIDRLVKHKYVQRIFDESDRRIIKISLTASGSDVVKKINHQRRDSILKVFGKIAERDRKEYLRILCKIKEVLTQEKVVE